MLSAILAACDADKALQNTSKNSDRTATSKAASKKPITRPKRSLGSTVKRAAAPAAAPAPLPEPVQKTTQVKADANGSVHLKWQVPTERENGESLAVQDIKGYEIYFTTEDGDTRTIRVNDPGKTSVTVEDLKPATYHFAMAVIDKDGEFSELSNTIPTTIE